MRANPPKRTKVRRSEVPWITRYRNLVTGITHDMRLWIEKWSDLAAYRKWLRERKLHTRRRV